MTNIQEFEELLASNRDSKEVVLDGINFGLKTGLLREGPRAKHRKFFLAGSKVQFTIPGTGNNNNHSWRNNLSFLRRSVKQLSKGLDIPMHVPERSKIEDVLNELTVYPISKPEPFEISSSQITEGKIKKELESLVNPNSPNMLQKLSEEIKSLKDKSECLGLEKAVIDERLKTLSDLSEWIGLAPVGAASILQSLVSNNVAMKSEDTKKKSLAPLAQTVLDLFSDNQMLNAAELHTAVNIKRPNTSKASIHTAAWYLIREKRLTRVANGVYMLNSKKD